MIKLRQTFALKLSSVLLTVASLITPVYATSIIGGSSAMPLPSISITSPSEDECLEAGKAYSIPGIQWTNPLSSNYHHFAIYETGETQVEPTSGSWIAHPVYKIMIGTDSATGEEVTGGVYSGWTVPNTPGAKVMIWVEAHNESHGRMDIASVGPFTVSSSCATDDEGTSGGDVSILPVPTLEASADGSDVDLSWGFGECVTQDQLDTSASGEGELQCVVSAQYYTSGFKIYRNNLLIASAAATSFVDKTAIPNETYTYQVIASDSKGNPSSKSKELTVRIPAIEPVVIPVLPTNPTTDDIRTVLSALTKQVAYLQAKLNSIPPAGSFSRSLSSGMSGDDVSALQNVLKSHGSDIYPQGLVTGYFGEATRKAVIKFQEKYSEEVLKPNGLTNGTGYVGSATLKKLNDFIALGQ